MFTTFLKNIDSKQLYFKLNNSLQIVNIEAQGQTFKYAGLYAIYKNNVCYYVGQSQNLGSRLSQHLTGKYSSADRVELYFVTEFGFDDFYTRPKETRKTILENNELALMQKLKPLENLITPDAEFSLSANESFTGLFEALDPDDYQKVSCLILMDNCCISVCEDDMADLAGNPGLRFTTLRIATETESHGKESILNGWYENGKV